ncbi:hypothetical protein [Haloglomus salinum]|uniref:hypothetical protein n=1 Tax=Haloglomus salinum TaxID=2962673 RepID=UPI0020CA168C|nr:hypothetical protein [Haloglomus salinum]
MAPEDNEPVLDWPLPVGEPGREVWYSLVSPTDDSVAFWYRYTLLSTEGGRQEGRLWAALTDREDPDRSVFVTRSVPFEQVRARGTPSFSLTIDDDELTSASAVGSIPLDADGDGEDADHGDPGHEGGEVSWDLSYDPDPYSFTPLRSERLTNALAKTVGTGKHWSANEAVRMDGEVTVGDRTIEFEDAPGHQGHTLGSSPPDSWTWIQCNDFEDRSVVLEALDIEGTLSICLRRDGEVHALNRLKHVVGPKSNTTEHDEPGFWRFSGSGEGVDLRVTVRAPEDVKWQTVSYMAPDESLRYNAHCSLADVTLTYTLDGDAPVTLESSAGRAEWVGAEPPLPDREYPPEW